MTTEQNQRSVDESRRNVVLSKRLEDFGWAVLLITIGTIWLMPQTLMPKGSWLIAAGVIMLGLNAIRYFNGIKMVGFSLVAGTLALLAGFGEFFGLTLPLFALTLIVIGLVMLIKPLVEKNSHLTVSQNWSCCRLGEQKGDEGAARGHASGH